MKLIKELTMKNVGLVLEGGGMRGLYTAGVLEYFMEKDLYFPYVIGVSAGACMAASYLSRQKGRNKKVNIDLVSDPRYLSFRNFVQKREIFGMDFLFDEVPNNVVPFDFGQFLNGKEQFVVGTTDCETGEPVYFNKDNHGNDMLKIIRASSSIPFISSSVEYDQKLLLDGGLADPIPLRKSQEDGNLKNIVILTKPAIQKSQPKRFASLIKYRKHPKIEERLFDRHSIYNDTISYMVTEKDKGNILVIQPSMELPVSSIERKKHRLEKLYELGYHDAKYQFEDVIQFINK
jgi:predicted patatin/cPLA2 family phospholipase